MMKNIEQFIREMPKAELNVNLEGTMEPMLRFQLAKRNDIELPYSTYEELKNSYLFPTLAIFLKAFKDGCHLLQLEQDFYELTYRFLKKTRLEHNVVYTELTFSPQLHISRGITMQTIMSGIQLACKSAEDKFGIETQLIVDFGISSNIDEQLKLFDMVMDYSSLITGISITGNGRSISPVDYRSIIEGAHAEGLKVTARNNVDDREAERHIRQCLFELEIDRLNDSVDCLNDDLLIEEVVRRDLVVTISPISTESGKTTKKPRRRNPRCYREIPIMLEKGIKVSLNTDDPAYFLGQYMNDMLLTIQKASALTEEQLITVMRNAFQGAWLESGKKDSYIKGLSEYKEI